MRNSKILHCLTNLDDGLSSRLCRRLISQLGSKLDHYIVTASGEADVERESIGASFPADFPQLDGMPTPGRLLKLAQAMVQYDLVLTYDYGTLNLAMAHTAFSQAFGLPPLVHNEFGYGQSGKSELSARRTWYRRIALGRTAALVVPSERMEGLALTTWQQPIGRVRYISPGVCVAEKAKKIAPDALRGLVKRDGEQWIGNLGGAGRSSDWQVALSALHQLPENWQFAIAGEGVHLSAIRDQAEKMELSHRVHLPGEVNDPAIFLGLLDVYIDLGAGEAFPINSLRAMGAGLPIAGISSGDLSSIVGKAGSEFIVDIKQGNELSHMLVSLAQDALSRKRIGEHNRSRAKGAYAEASMIEKFRRLCANLLGREL